MSRGGIDMDLEYDDWITVRPAALDEQGEPLPEPDPGTGLAAAPGGVWVNSFGQLFFLARVRCPAGQKPSGIAYRTEAEFQAAKPSLWSKYMPEGGSVAVFL